MKKIFLLFVLSFFLIPLTYSQKDVNGYGFYMGYGFGRYTPGLGNLKSTMYLYDQQYGANFNYNDHLGGLDFGFKIVHGFWQTDIEWILRHSSDESTFIEPDSKEEWKMGFRTRYNSLFWGNAFRFHSFAAGAGLEIGYFKIYNKRTPVGEYDDAGWTKNTIYGTKIALSDILAINSGFLLYCEYMPQFFGIRASYAIPMNSADFSNDNELTFYTFTPSNFRISIFLNLSLIK